MTKVDIISGFLGAGKTTFIKRLVTDVFQKEQIVLIENEFGEIGIDGGFLKDAGIEITEMNSGCICCTLVGDFSEALKQVVEQYHPDRILIEPSGVGKLSDVAGAVRNVEEDCGIELNSCITVADGKKVKSYLRISLFSRSGQGKNTLPDSRFFSPIPSSSTKTRPMILRFASGSFSPASADRKRSSAAYRSATTVSMCPRSTIETRHIRITDRNL